MPRKVIALNNHPFGGRMYARGERYEIDRDEDFDVLVSLKRVRALTDAESRSQDDDGQKYRTRELRAGQAAIIGTHGTVPVERTDTKEDIANVARVADGKKPTAKKTPNKDGDK